MRLRIPMLSCLCLATGLAMAAGAAATPPEKTPKTDLEKLHHALGEIGAQVTNAGAKLKHGAVSMGGRSANSAATPARMCCANNIEKIEKQLADMALAIKGLRRCYQGEQNADAEVKMNLVHQDAGSVYRALDNFGAAKPADVLLGYGAVVRGVLFLEKSSKELTECPASP